MKHPEWLREAISAAGVQVLDGNMTRAGADAAVAAATREHPEFGADLGAAAATGLLGKWLREHSSSGDLFQAQMFADLPASLLVTPGRRTPVADMTAEDLDHAKNMLYARTQNAIDGVTKAALGERAAFDALYGKVRPLLKGDMTVGDALGALATQPVPDSLTA